MPDRIIAAAAQDLHDGIDDLHVLVERVQAKSRRQRVATCVLAVVVVGMGVLAWFQRAEAQERVRETARARYSNCVSHNVEQEGDRNSALNGALVTYGFAESGELTAKERAVIVSALPLDLQLRYRLFEAQLARDNEFRDCSPEGIAEFIANAPADPAAGS